MLLRIEERRRKLELQGQGKGRRSPSPRRQPLPPTHLGHGALLPLLSLCCCFWFLLGLSKWFLGITWGVTVLLGSWGIHLWWHDWHHHQFLDQSNHRFGNNCISATELFGICSSNMRRGTHVVTMHIGWVGSPPPRSYTISCRFVCRMYAGSFLERRQQDCDAWYVGLSA